MLVLSLHARTHAYTHVLMHSCRHARTHTYIHTRTHMQIHTHTHTHTSNAHTHTHTHTHTHKQTTHTEHTHAHAHTYTHNCVCLRAHTHTHTHMYTCTSAHTHNSVCKWCQFWALKKPRTVIFFCFPDYRGVDGLVDSHWSWDTARGNSGGGHERRTGRIFWDFPRGACQPIGNTAKLVLSFVLTRSVKIKKARRGMTVTSWEPCEVSSFLCSYTLRKDQESTERYED